jgi:hypothetical protein
MAINRGSGSCAEYSGMQDPKLGRSPKLMNLLYGGSSPIVDLVLTEQSTGETVETPGPEIEWTPADPATAFKALGYPAVTELGSDDTMSKL